MFCSGTKALDGFNVEPKIDKFCHNFVLRDVRVDASDYNFDYPVFRQGEGMKFDWVIFQCLLDITEIYSRDCLDSDRVVDIHFCCYAFSRGVETIQDGRGDFTPVRRTEDNWRSFWFIFTGVRKRRGFNRLTWVYRRRWFIFILGDLGSERWGPSLDSGSIGVAAPFLLFGGEGEFIFRFVLDFAMSADA